MSHRREAGYVDSVDQAAARRARDKIVRLAGRATEWVAMTREIGAVLVEAVPFTRACWHTVDPGTVLFTGSLNENIACSGTWLAEHEYVIEDVNKWWFLARSGRLAGASSIATHGQLSRSARHRSHASYGLGDELRAAFVADGTYWGAVGLLREHGAPWFTTADERLLASLSEPVARGIRRTMLPTAVVAADMVAAEVDVAEVVADAPGVVLFGDDGRLESVSPGAERWIAELVEEPAPASATESPTVQAVAARARSLGRGHDPLGLAARARVRTRGGRWLLLYGTPLSGGDGRRVAVIVQPAPAAEIAPIVALAYGLSERECEVTRLCMQGRSTKDMAAALAVSPYTVQDHLKAIFRKTGVCTRGELVGQVFLEHYVPRWEHTVDAVPRWEIPR
jgi:DNA-binding CsgD family transcriptional regulator